MKTLLVVVAVGKVHAFLQNFFIKGGEDDEYRSVFMDWNSHLYLYTTERKIVEVPTCTCSNHDPGH